MNLKKQILSLTFSAIYVSSISSSCLAGNIFTDEEDSVLTALVISSGANPNWVQIADTINQTFHPTEGDNKRTPRQCRERYNNYLSGTNKSPMSESDFVHLKELVDSYGYKWNLFVKHFPGKTETELKNAFLSRYHNLSVNNVEGPFEDEFPNEESVTVNGFKYKLMSNISKRGECFWNILRKHMGNTPNTNTVLQQVAYEIGVEFNKSLDYFRLDDFFRALNSKGYNFGYTLALIDPSHSENSVEQQSLLVEGGQTLKLALFGNFGPQRTEGHYVEAQNENEPEEIQLNYAQTQNGNKLEESEGFIELQNNVGYNERLEPSNSLFENNNYEFNLFGDVDENIIPF